MAHFGQKLRLCPVGFFGLNHGVQQF